VPKRHYCDVVVLTLKHREPGAWRLTRGYLIIHLGGIYALSSSYIFQVDAILAIAVPQLSKIIGT
jgi:hypothetical protein